MQTSKILLKLFIFTIIIMNYTYSWKNWAGNQVCNPKAVFAPKSLEELQKIIKNASTEKKHIRTVGSGHSWSNLVCTHDYIVDLKNLNKILKIDQEKKQVKVQAGIRLKDLYEQLAKNRLALENQAAIQEQTLAGAISTATHGSGKTGTLASFIVGIDLITSDGKILELTPQNNNQIFSTAVTSIGALGIIYALTIQCVDLFKLKEINYKTTWDIIKNQYKQLLENNNYFQFTIDPYTNTVFAKIINRSDNVNQISQNSKYQNQIDKNSIVNEFEDYSYKVLSGNPAPLYFEEEIAVEKKNFLPAIEAVFKLIKKWQEKNLKISYILIRFAKPDLNNFLSHAAGRDTAFISIMTAPDKKFYPFYKDYYQTLLPFGGRPHWGKINFLNTQDAFKLYGKNFTEFKIVRDKLDPNRVFSNDFVNNVFGN